MGQTDVVLSEDRCGGHGGGGCPRSLVLQSLSLVGLGILFQDISFNHGYALVLEGALGLISHFRPIIWAENNAYFDSGGKVGSDTLIHDSLRVRDEQRKT